MNDILSRFCPRIEFDSYEDFFENYRCIVPEDFNFAYDVVDQWAKIAPDKRALLWTNDEGTMQTYSFSDIKKLSDKAANVFKSQGIKKGDVVMLILKQRPEVWISMVALEKIGAVCIPGTYQLTRKDLLYRCNIAEVKALITIDDEGLLDNLEKVLPECKTVTVKALVGAGTNIPQGFIDFRRAIDEAPEEFSGPVRGEAARLGKPRIPPVSEPMLIYFSSGTTGMPKMVLHDHSLPLGHIVTAKYWHGVEDGTVHMTQTDSGWAKFAWGKIYGQWICGAAIGVYDTEKFTPKGMLEAIQRIKPASFCAPATIFRFLIKEDLSSYDFSFITHTSVAGEPLSPEVFYQIKEKTGLEIREGFGQSETSVMAASFKWIPVRPGSMGKPAPLFGLTLLDENGKPCDDGMVGNISITAAGTPGLFGPGGTPLHTVADSDPAGAGLPIPGLFRGYWKDDEITRALWYDGAYRTGDMAWRDADGYYWFMGRNDDVIKCSGYRIGPFEVESALMEHPSVLECAVTAAPDPMRGQVVKATVVLARGFDPSEDLVRELQNHVKRVTAPYKYPRIVEFVDELPKTVSGKIQRNLIRQRDWST
ncbi:MAG: AMP-binding protein [Spirochaetaceae bacterium]|jgi:acetyl-CoA synthetase|nr:AMP-binding protein [Spirochaetaceae bacterium]